MCKLRSLWRYSISGEQTLPAPNTRTCFILPNVVSDSALCLFFLKQIKIN